VPDPPEPEIRFRVFALRPLEGISHVSQAGAPLQRLDFYPTARSPEYVHRGAKPLEFFDSATGSVVGSASVPPDIRHALLIFDPLPPGDAGVGLRYRIYVLDDGASRHAAAGLSLVNLSGLSLTGTLGDAAIAVRTGLNPQLRVGSTTGLELRTSYKNRSYRAFADTVSLPAGERALLILFPPFYPGSLEVQGRMLMDVPPVGPLVRPLTTSPR